MSNRLDIAGFENRGFAYIHYDRRLSQAVGMAAQNWREFCQIPLADREQFPYQKDGRFDGSGLEIKDGVGTRDKKQTFQIQLWDLPRLLKAADLIRDPTALKFVTSAAALVGVMSEDVMNFAEEAEKAYDITDFADEVAASRGKWILRFLHYYGRQPGDMLAQRHADTSGVTLYLHQSHPGVQCLDREHCWQDMWIHPDMMTVTSNLQLQHRSRGKLTGLCHQVVATPEAAVAGRFAIVCFILLTKSKVFDTAARGRQQDLSPGWNYPDRITPAEFDKFFIDPQ